MDVVTEEERMEFLPKYFGEDCLHIETLIYKSADRDITEYNGGAWQFCRVPGDAPLIIWDTDDEHVNVTNPHNYYQGEMTPRAASIGINIALMNHFGWYLYNNKQMSESKKYFDYYSKLRDWAFNDNNGLSSEEVRSIASYID